MCCTKIEVLTANCIRNFEHKISNERIIDMIFETHAHYDDSQFDEDRDQMLEGLPAAGVGKVVDIGSSRVSNDKIIELIMGDIIAITSNCQKNLNMKEVKLDVSDDDIIINILGIDTNTGMNFELPHSVNREQYKINEANTHNIIKLKESLFIDFEWCIEQRKKINKKLKKLMNK